jgi:hypothetical protein
MYRTCSGSACKPAQLVIKLGIADTDHRGRDWSLCLLPRISPSHLPTPEIPVAANELAGSQLVSIMHCHYD